MLVKQHVDCSRFSVSVTSANPSLKLFASIPSREQQFLERFLVYVSCRWNPNLISSSTRTESVQMSLVAGKVLTVVGVEGKERERRNPNNDVKMWDVGEDAFDSMEDVYLCCSRRKKYVSALLKKAGELVEMADEVLDEGLENNPTDSGFIELKELRNQLFEVPTYSQLPRNNPDEKEEDDPTNFRFHTPDDGRKQYPITQVYGSPTGYGELHDKVWEEWHRQAE
ncbi:hypothetical protein Tco_0966255 [Tanacetum coccineum]